MTKVLRNGATLLLSMALLLLVGGSAAAQHSNNPRYQQFRDTAAASITTPAANNVRLFFDSTGFYWKNSAGTTTAVGGTLSGLTTGVVPQAGSATTIVNSKMATSGTNSGTWTLYDNTAVTGVTQFVIRAGANNAVASPLLEVLTSAGSTTSAGYGVVSLDNGGNVFLVGAQVLAPNRTSFRLGGSGVYLPNTSKVHFSADGSDYGTVDTALARSAAGILAVTDGSTGQGGIGLSDAATNTVSDALILRHATSGTAAASFGTGLLFQGEDAAGNMNSMAQIQAVYTDATDASEDANLVFRVITAGTVGTLATLTSVGSVATAPQLTVVGGFSISTDGTLNLVSTGSSIDLRAAGPTNLYSGSVARWQVSSDFYPLATNTYDIGTSSATVREVFAETHTAVGNLVLGANNTDTLVLGSTYFGPTGAAAGVLNLGDGGALFKSAYVSTSIQGTRTQAISDNAAAATFVTVAVPTSNTTVGGRIFYTITAIDAGTAIQTKTGTYSFGLNNIGGTVTGAGTDVLEHPQLSAGTLAPTFSVNISGTNAQFQLVLDTSLDAGAETLKIEYRVQIDSGTATVTPAT